MSIMLARYSGFPPEIFEHGIVPKMRDSAVRLYLFLCRRSDQKSSRRFTVTDKEVTKECGASARALGVARKNLVQLGLMVCEREPGGSYAYVLCDVNTGEPYPGDPKVKAGYAKRNKVDKPVAASPIPSKPLTYDFDSTGDTQSTAGDDVGFPFGCNSKPSAPAVSVEDYSPFARSRSGR